MKQDIQMILFDLGGVLVELNGLPFEDKWFPDAKQKPILHEWGIADVCRRFESGKASDLEFANFTIEEFSLKTDANTFIQKFKDWPGPLFPGVLDVIKKLRTQTKVAIYSNTNDLHWPRLMQDMQLDGNFDHYFASHKIGFAKPDPQGFQHVATEMGISPEQILFIDDNIHNVESAKKLGYIAKQALGFEQVKNCLNEHGFTI